MTVPRQVYGIAEFADELGEPRGTVAQWRRRDKQRPEGKRKLPTPTEELASGPVWIHADAGPFIDQYRQAKQGRQQAAVIAPHTAAVPQGSG